MTNFGRSFLDKFDNKVQPKNSYWLFVHNFANLNVHVKALANMNLCMFFRTHKCEIPKVRTFATLGSHNFV
jgi:hypothetical protein